MLRPYHLIEETDTERTYEFRTVYVWVLYAILAAGAVGYFARLPMLTGGAIFMLLLYAATVS